MSTVMPAAAITEVGAEAIDMIMEIMDEAFVPGFGEAWNRAQCSGILGLPGVWLALATQGGEPSGFALGRIILDEAELLLIGVRPNQRRRGIGKQLLEYMINRAVHQGAMRLHLEMREGNNALTLYERMSFATVGRRSGYYNGKLGQSFDALTLVRLLNAKK